MKASGNNVGKSLRSVISRDSNPGTASNRVRKSTKNN
jgi:hypothetical protein